MSKPPHNEHELELALTRLAGGNVRAIRLRDAMAAVILGQMLPAGCAIKGGTSMRFRMGMDNSRTTLDFDAVRKAELDDFLKDLRIKLKSGWNDFTGEAVILKQGSPKNVPFEYVMQPIDVKLSYRNHAWCTIRLEVSHNELGDADEVEMCDIKPEMRNAFRALNFPAPVPVPLMTIPFQVAQKLHGVSQHGSMRARDLIDLQLMLSCSDLDLSRTADICRRLFVYRRMQPWPPKVELADGWAKLYSEQKLELPVLPTVDEAVVWVNGLIHKIDMSSFS